MPNNPRDKSVKKQKKTGNLGNAHKVNFSQFTIIKETNGGSQDNLTAQTVEIKPKMIGEAW